MNYLIESYNEKASEINKNCNIELETTYHIIKSTDIYKDIFNKLKDLSSDIIIIENLDIFYKDNIRVTKTFKNGVNQNIDKIIKKKSIMKPFTFRENINNILNFRLKLNSEEDILANKLNSIQFIRLKLRITFMLKENKNFKVDLDLIKNINVNEKHIKEIKNLLFKPYKIDSIIENINYQLFDEIVLETEFINKEISTNDIDESVNFVKMLFNENINNDYQKYIYRVARFIIKNKTYLENFRQRSGFKKLLNNVLELNNNSYYKNIVPNITNFYITDKIDGQRCICYIEEYNDIKNIKLITNKLYSIKEYNDVIILNDDKNIKKLITILDCEIIFNKNKDKDIISENDIFLYIFDIIALENDKTAFKPFEDRVELLNDGYNKVKMLSNVNIKEYKKLTSEYRTEIKEFYNKKSKSTKYEIDGLIFVPTSKVSNTDSKFSSNDNYNNMIGYKWKPIEHMTIDFFVCKLPKNLYDNIPYNKLNVKNKDEIYILFSGISKQDYYKFNLTYMLDYKKIVPDNFLNGSIFPIQFSVSDNPYNYIYISDNKDEDLDKKICEFNYDTKNKEWIFKQIRTDRDVELARGEYFGNYYKIAEYIWNNINNPLTFDMLISDNVNYFMTDDNLFYKSQRSFNSFVKTYVLQTN